MFDIPFTLTIEMQLRLALFALVLLLLMSCEKFFPRRAQVRRGLRWPGNLGVVAINAVMLAVVPVSAVAASLVAIHNHFGLLIWFKVSLWHSIIVSLLVLDLTLYWQHRLLHRIAWLWPIHRMHHTDTAIDATTALRFHPLEMLLSAAIKAAVVVLLGAPLLGVILFEMILNAAAMFNHANIKLPTIADKLLRAFVVTPDMHRVHHSTDAREYNRNYGFNLSLWDRVFGSYTAQPAAGHRAMQIGQPNYRADEEARLHRLLSQPFRKSMMRKATVNDSTHNNSPHTSRAKSNDDE